MDDRQCAYYQELYELIKNDYDGAAEDQIAVWEDRIPARQPLLLRCRPTAEQARRYPSYNYGEIHHDKAKMLLHGMTQMLAAANGGMQAVPSIRANMGCGIYASLFPGIMPRLFYDDRMPWVVNHLSKDTISGLREKDIVVTDEFKLALEHMAYQAEKLGGSGAYVYPLDLQGPFDTAHLVYGDAFFYDLYDDPAFIHHLMELSVYALTLGMEACFKLIPDSRRFLAHYNELVMPRSRGGVKVSEDTSTLVCAEHLDEFVIPYLGKVLGYAGGGYVHFCGRHDILLERLLKLDLVRGVNFGNPEKTDMDATLKIIAEAGKVYYGTVPMSEGEDYRAYFRRVTRNATADGRCRLLLSFGTSSGEQARVQEAWRDVWPA